MFNNWSDRATQLKKDRGEEGVTGLDILAILVGIYSICWFICETSTFPYPLR
jgi:hypothetical protein